MWADQAFESEPSIPVLCPWRPCQARQVLYFSMSLCFPRGRLGSCLASWKAKKESLGVSLQSPFRVYIPVSLCLAPRSFTGRRIDDSPSSLR
jgi:hypothetical protein